MNVTAIIIASGFAVTLVLSGALFVLLNHVRQSRSPVARVIAASASVIVLILAPWAFDSLVLWLNPPRGMMYVSIDPGWIVKLLPAAAAVIITAVLMRRPFRRRGSPNHFGSNVDR